MNGIGHDTARQASHNLSRASLEGLLNVSVIAREEIRRSGAVNIADSLRFVPEAEPGRNDAGAARGLAAPAQSR